MDENYVFQTAIFLCTGINIQKIVYHTFCNSSWWTKKTSI